MRNHTNAAVFTSSKAKLLVLSVIMLLVLVLSACGENSKNEAANAPAKTTDTTAAEPAKTEPEPAAEPATAIETPKLTLVGVRDAQISSQQIIADKMGYFKEEGLDVTSQLIESGPDIGPLVAGGSATVSIQTNFMDIILKSNNVRVKIVAPLAQIAGTQAVVGGKDLNLTAPKIWKAKRSVFRAGRTS